MSKEDLKLTDDELRQLEAEPGVGQFQRKKLEVEAKKNWDLFYKRNGDRFFKNRYWTRHEFVELFNECNSDGQTKLLEIGCGCGDFALPLIENLHHQSSTDSNQPNLLIYCCDFSDQAIDILKSNPIYVQNCPTRIEAFVADITGDVALIKSRLAGGQVDIISLIFVLSAIEPTKMESVIENVCQLLAPGGLLLFRDYAVYDKAMLRFKSTSKIDDQFYVRQDGTRAYFFSKDRILSLFNDQRFHCQSIEYVSRETVNHATKDKFSRRFLQAKFRRT